MNKNCRAEDADRSVHRLLASQPYGGGGRGGREGEKISRKRAREEGRERRKGRGHCLTVLNCCIRSSRERGKR